MSRTGTPVVIALGSNLGDRRTFLERATRCLSESVQITALSPWFETEPMYTLDQPRFLNGIVLGTAYDGPLTLFNSLKGIEMSLGRQERERNGPREIDLDLIAFGTLTLTSNLSGGVILPHPRAHERIFVLAPWAAADPDATLPGHGRVSDLLLQLAQQTGR